MSSIAWGERPGTWPIPAASDPHSRWSRAVALGGQGRYSLGQAELNVVERDSRSTRALLSLCASTRASWLRQMGSHARAARYDGIAIAAIGFADTGSADAEALCDALTGLAADALGRGGFCSADVLLWRCEVVLGEHASSALWRQRLRLHWVRAELAMFSGDGTEAVRHANEARELVTEIDSLRHSIKTELIVSAAQCSVGNVDRGREGAYRVLDVCTQHGMVPLRWAAAMLLDGLGETETATPIVAECAEILRRRGGFLVDA